MLRLLLLLLLLLAKETSALDNGLGLLPPQAWRSWNVRPTSAGCARSSATTPIDGACAATVVRLPLTVPTAAARVQAFHENFNQSTIHDMIDALVDKSRTVDGKPTSLKDLGYDMIGIGDWNPPASPLPSVTVGPANRWLVCVRTDEGWEGCGLGVNGTQHYANGTPAIRPDFPDLKALVDYGHSKGVKMGFYLNGCACGERTEHRINYEGDVNLTFALGFECAAAAAACLRPLSEPHVRSLARSLAPPCCAAA
jgi:hypothetical protein